MGNGRPRQRHRAACKGRREAGGGRKKAAGRHDHSNQCTRQQRETNLEPNGHGGRQGRDHGGEGKTAATVRSHARGIEQRARETGAHARGIEQRAKEGGRRAAGGRRRRGGTTTQTSALDSREKQIWNQMATAGGRGGTTAGRERQQQPCRATPEASSNVQGKRAPTPEASSSVQRKAGGGRRAEESGGAARPVKPVHSTAERNKSGTKRPRREAGAGPRRGGKDSSNRAEPRQRHRATCKGNGRPRQRHRAACKGRRQAGGGRKKAAGRHDHSNQCT